MPVIQHEIHSSVQQSSDAKYGCWNKPRSRGPLIVQDGYLTWDDKFRYAIPKFKTIENFGSLECRYDHSLTDSKCKDCCHIGSGEDYAEFIRNNGS